MIKSKINRSLARTEPTLSNSSEKCDEFLHNNQKQSTSYKICQNKCTQFDPLNSSPRE